MKLIIDVINDFLILMAFIIALATYDSLTKNKSFWIVMFVAALLIAKEILINKL